MRGTTRDSPASSSSVSSCASSCPAILACRTGARQKGHCRRSDRAARSSRTPSLRRRRGPLSITIIRSSEPRDLVERMADIQHRDLRLVHEAARDREGFRPCARQSSAAKGSSRSSALGFIRSARPSATRERSPPDSVRRTAVEQFFKAQEPNHGGDAGGIASTVLGASHRAGSLGHRGAGTAARSWNTTPMRRARRGHGQPAFGIQERLAVDDDAPELSAQ
mgnify:CR=1 FL=1